MTEKMHNEFENEMFTSVNLSANLAHEEVVRRRAARKTAKAIAAANIKKKQVSVIIAAIAVILTSLAYAYTKEIVSATFFALALEAALICFGWYLNNAVYVFRRKSRTARKG